MNEWMTTRSIQLWIIAELWHSSHTPNIVITVWCFCWQTVGLGGHGLQKRDLGGAAPRPSGALGDALHPPNSCWVCDGKKFKGVLLLGKIDFKDLLSPLHKKAKILSPSRIKFKDPSSGRKIEGSIFTGSETKSKKKVTAERKKDYNRLTIPHLVALPKVFL